MMRLRTYDEMDMIYQERHKQGLSGASYVLRYESNGQKLFFFGSRHSADPDDNEWKILEKEWQEFISASNKYKHVFCEGHLRPVNALSKQQSIIKHAETGLICWLADKYNIPISSPEPDRAEEIDYLTEQGFTFEQIITFYFARQMLQWLSYDHSANPDWQAYAANTLQRYQTAHSWGGLRLELDKVLAMYKNQTGKEFSDQDKKQLYALSHPAQNPVTSASGQLRDIRLFNAIKENWMKGYDVFIVYGSGHAIVLEPALEELVKA
ncbi:hypothetical protein BH23PAT1_BH23PAT1_5540 [soil metagenome]